MAYDFHYTPTGTGVISGKEVLEQTEDAINDLGNTAISGVQEALDKAEQALTNSENAVDDAQTALNTANNAEGVAIQAQTDVGNLSGTVTNIGNRVTTAEGNISNLQGRMTTAEGNITNLQGRMTTAETNIGNLQTAVSTAQATANSAQQTATTARQQSYVFRYSGTAVVPNSTIAYSTIDNTDNIKSGDKILDVDGKLFEITAVDTANQTVTVGTALIDLAKDIDVVHTSGNETISGTKNFTNNTMVVGRNTDVGSAIQLINSDVVGDSANGSSGFEVYGSSISDANKIGSITIGEFSNNGGSYATIENNRTVSGVKSSNAIRSLIRPDGSKELSATVDNDCKLGTEFLRWSKIYGTEYYYGSNNVEFSTKFVTTDTEQTVDGKKQLNAYLTLNGSQMNDEFSNNARTCAYFTANRDTVGKSGVFVSKFRQNRAQGSISGTDVVQLTFDVYENEVRTNRTWYLNWLDWNNDVPETVEIRSMCNKVDYKLTHINNLEPSALGMPDLSNGIDISGYITLDTSSNTYTPPANGWICIKGVASGNSGIYVESTNGFYASANSIVDINSASRFVNIAFPVVKDEQYTIVLKSINTSITAKFFPCQGNV